MIIGWATIGIMWNRPVMVVAVRESRYTYELMNKAKDFTVSIPIEVDLSEEIEFFGTKSGRDYDKYREMDLTLSESNMVESPIIKECDQHFECKIIYSQFMEAENLNDEIQDSAYKDGNYHRLYYGEIVDRY